MLYNIYVNTIDSGEKFYLDSTVDSSELGAAADKIPDCYVYVSEVIITPECLPMDESKVYKS